jgi:uncharacterized protein (DUF3084 family)
MERIDPRNVSALLRAEHWHRYLWAASLARGAVIDAACGVGYGVEPLLNAQPVTTYIGVDVSDDAIAHANEHYARDRATFVRGDVTDLALANASADTIVSLETIEHLDEPARAIAEFKRVLKPDGLLLTSVPSAAFEAACTDAYGPNEHHKSTFTLERITALLAGHFKHVRVWSCGLSICSVLRPMLREADGTARLDPQAPNSDAVMGSYLLLATDDAEAAANAHARVHLLESVSVVEHDSVTVKPLREANQFQTVLINERDKALASQAAMIRERGALLRQQDARLEELRGMLSQQATLIEQRDKRISNMELMLKDRDDALKAQARMIDERDALLRTQDTIIAARDKSIAELTGSLTASQEHTAGLVAETQAATRLAEERAQILANAEALVQDRDAAIAAQTKLIDERDAYITRLEAVVRERDIATRAQAVLIDERDAYIAKLEGIVRDRDTALKSQAGLIEERSAYIGRLESGVRERNETISRLEAARRADADTARSGDAELRRQIDNSLAALAAARATIAARTEQAKSLEARIDHLEAAVRDVEARRADDSRSLESPIYCVKLTARALFGGTSAGAHTAKTNARNGNVLTASRAPLSIDARNSAQTNGSPTPADNGVTVSERKVGE